jgi:hypothetical protein
MNLSIKDDTWIIRDDHDTMAFTQHSITFSGVATTGLTTTQIANSLSGHTEKTTHHCGVEVGPFPVFPDDVGLAAPDILYATQIPITSPVARFHFCAWLHGDEQRKAQMWTMIDALEAFKASRLSFTSRRARAAFVAWWKGYRARFFGGRDPLDAYLPTFETGHIGGGTFIEARSMLDSLPHDWARAPGQSDSAILSAGLRECVAPWGWIVENCRARVYRVQGGWFFTRPADAASFRLFSGATR